MAALNFPDSPQEGEVFTAGIKTWRFVNGAWVSLGTGEGTVIASQDTQPPNPDPGDLWFDSNTGVLNVYYDDGDSQFWVDVSSGAGTGVVALTGGLLLDTEAEAQMTTPGLFYEWSEKEIGLPVGQKLTYKRADGTYQHIPQLIHGGATFVVGSDPGDDFATPFDACMFLSDLKVGHRGNVTVEIKPGEYTIPKALEGHPDGYKILYKPVDRLEVSNTYPLSSDFTGVSATDIAMLKSKYDVVVKAPEFGINCKGGNIRCQDILFESDGVLPVEDRNHDGCSVQDGGHALVSGCAFVGFRYGIRAYQSTVDGSDTVTSAYNWAQNFNANYNGSIVISGSGHSVGSNYGAIIRHSSSFKISTFNILSAATAGINVQRNATAGIDGSHVLNIQGTGGGSINVDGFSSLYAGNATIINNDGSINVREKGYIEFRNVQQIDQTVRVSADGMVGFTNSADISGTINYTLGDDSYTPDQRTTDENGGTTYITGSAADGAIYFQRN